MRPLFEHCNFLTDGKIAKIGHFLAKLEGNGARLYFSCFFIRLDMKVMSVIKLDMINYRKSTNNIFPCQPVNQHFHSDAF